MTTSYPILDFLPGGFRFRPTQEELVNHDLKNKLLGDDDSDKKVGKGMDIYRLGKLFDFFRMISFYFTTAFSGLGEAVSEKAKLMMGNTALDAALNAQFLVQIGVFTAVPMILGFILELGLLKAVFSFITMQLQLPNIFNPSGFQWQKTVEDFDDWTSWLLCKVGVKGENSWESWWLEEQVVVHKDSPRGLHFRRAGLHQKVWILPRQRGVRI